MDKERIISSYFDKVHAEVEDRQKRCIAGEVVRPIPENILHTAMHKWTDELWDIHGRKRFSLDITDFAKSLVFELDDVEQKTHTVRNILNSLVDFPVFARLSTRSPKDSKPDCIFNDAQELLSHIKGSMRTFEDMCDLLMAQEKVFLYCFDPLFFMGQSEFRCFVKDGVMTGITQYIADQKPYLPQNMQHVVSAAKNLFSRISSATHLKSYVFDFIFYDKRNTSRRYILSRPLDGFNFYDAMFIEINPYGLSDPIFFNDYKTIEELYEAKGEMTLRYLTTTSEDYK